MLRGFHFLDPLGGLGFSSKSQLCELGDINLQLRDKHVGLGGAQEYDRRRESIMYSSKVSFRNRTPEP